MFGTIERKLDDKNRVILPPVFRDSLGSTFFITVGFDGNAELRSEDNFNKYVAEIESKSMFDKNARILRRSILGRATQIQLDSQGRFLVPKNIIDLTSIQKNVVFVGVGSFVEFWAKEAYDSQSELNDGDLIANIAQKLSGINN
ncbi:cell division/cell wall cluster transcriptional repressor MraZ [Mycoplasmopsis ciconiae]|uniref:Transcriptional regulator MraZ n=1 Tax=Mycoplasmopsis ciconiae TaxID=561067 RepID=A0ABU7MKL5_9BACT|nr:cell division/cell wall cluster transcriptional repressor MraZ [Mycoplasmopsis ciconiae]